MSQILLDLQEKYRLIVSKWVYYRVKSKILKILIDNYEENYARLGQFSRDSMLGLVD